MNFKNGEWNESINLRDFIIRNYTPYDGTSDFLAGPTEKTKKLSEKMNELLTAERENGGVLDIDEHTISTITSHKPGYIDKELEEIVGVQTDAPLKRAIMPFGGIRMVRTSLETHGKKLPEDIETIFKYRKTHNDGVFDVYTDDMKKARHAGIITGLPDAYGRGRIIGDYRRIALYGVDKLIEEKIRAKKSRDAEPMYGDTVRDLEEIAEQIKALRELKAMAESYGYDISGPAKNTKEAIQWLYFGYLAAVKEQNGAAMSLGRVSTFLDIYAENDLKEGTFTEEQIQELVDHFIMKLRLVRFLRTPEYDELFSGDPTWVTESIGGMCKDGRHMVTKMSYRFLHTLKNLGPAPEPNLTVLWSENLPENFKHFCVQTSIDTSAIQYENDELMRAKFGDDYGIACCVSAMEIGKQMQFFGARANLAKALLYSINDGCDEKSGIKLCEGVGKLPDGPLNFDEVLEKFDYVSEWLTKLYINTLNIIHFMHDKYCYERIQMALHDENIRRTSACGLSGLSVVIDSLSAIKYAKVTPVKNEDGLCVDFNIEGDYPKYGNNDPRADEIGTMIVKRFMKRLARRRTYRNSIPTMSILTITSNVVYGKKTGNTPDGRKAGVPFAPGANPMHGRDTNGCVASMLSVSKIPYEYAEDGISYTFSIVPAALGKENTEKVSNLSTLIDGYMKEHGHHINVNVLNKETLVDAMDHPEKYPQLTIRVSGYAVNFTRLTREQQLDVISRTFHTFM
ncbi:MAG: formate C-acetyltransferase [Oscillospiraceae bacterium]|nr:formate C-acetyltransferase [Oscillospiraceae bacterium]